MPALRRFATRLLNVVTRHSSPESQPWGRAMLRELDFIANDWTALRWAFGSTTRCGCNCGPGCSNAWPKRVD